MSKESALETPITQDFAATFAAEIGDGKRHTIAIDAEWDSRFKPSLILGYALVVDAKYKFVVLNQAIRDNNIEGKNGKKFEVPEEIIKRMENYCKAKDYVLHWQAEDYILQWMPLDDDSCDATSSILKQYKIQKGSFDVLMFYSPKDLNISFGFDNLDAYYKKGKISQKKRISGSYRNGNLRYRICDLSGWTNTSLKEFAKSVGVAMTSKDTMDDYKSRMLDGLIDHPETFIDYMVGDTTCLFEIREKFFNQIQKVQRDYFGLPEEGVDSIDTLPLTIGSIVATTFERYIRCCLSPDRQKELRYCLLKLGIINPDTRNRKEIASLHNECLQNIKDAESYQNNDSIASKLYEEYRGKYQFEAFSQCSVNHFGRATRSSECFLALVQGGRCANEQYWRYSLDYAADIDIKSAYASALRRIEYPIGLPTITAFTPNQDRCSLEEWFNDTEVLKSDSRNWMVVVSGKLSFQQDLLYSKVTSQKKINRAVIGATEDAIGVYDHNDNAHIDGYFIQARTELENAVITADLWETIKKVATTQELKEFRNLEVVAGAYYSDQDKCTDVNEWIDTVLADGCEYKVKPGTGGIDDKRTKAWFSVPLEQVFGNIINERIRLKAVAKEAKALGRHEEYLEANSLQEALKLFVNTGYGVLASPYFEISNTVVANNITAQVRLAVWQMSKALNTCQSITDGGFYEPGNVNLLKTHLGSFRKPSLASLCDLWELQANRNVQFTSLGGRSQEWKSLIDEIFREDLTDEEKKRLQKELAEKSDKLALEHIKQFWQAYDLDFQFCVEHKAENFAKRVAFWSKGDYGFVPAIGEQTYYKIRGAKKNRDKQNRNHPKFELFDNILAFKDVFPEDMEHIFTCLLKLEKFKQIQNSQKGYKNLKDVRPGDEIVESRTASFNNTHMPVDTIRDYLKREKRSLKKDIKLFEKHRGKGIKWVHGRMMDDDLYGRNS